MKLVEPQASLALQNILYLTDFSKNSDAAFAHAIAFAANYHATLFVLHVVPPEPNLGVPLDPMPRAMDTALAEGERQMDAFVRGGTLKGLKHEVMVSEGDIEAVVAEAVTHHRIDLIVMGTHGRTGIGKVLLGSVAEKILRLSPVPVLTIGPQCGNRFVLNRRMKVVIFATDLSSDSVGALPYACTLASENRGKLVMLHVVEGDGSRDVELAADLKRHMLDLLPVGVVSSCETEPVVEFGSVTETILSLARMSLADLLVLGVRTVPHPVFAAHLPWPVLSGVVAHASCPVLTVRHE